ASRGKREGNENGTRKQSSLPARMQGLQAEELRHQQEQADDAGQARIFEVLPALPQAYVAPRDQVGDTPPFQIEARNVERRRQAGPIAPRSHRAGSSAET